MFEWLFSKKDQENRSIGSKMRQIRLRKGMSTADLGSKCGITDSAVRHYEGDLRQPKDDKLGEIAAALGVDVSALYDRKIESISDIMHILFEIEADGYVAPTKLPTELHNTRTTYGVRTMNEVLNEAMEKWCEQRELWETEQISDDDYCNWKDAFPQQYETEVNPKYKTYSTKSFITDYRVYVLNELAKMRTVLLYDLETEEIAIEQNNPRYIAEAHKILRQNALAWVESIIAELAKEPLLENTTLNPALREASNNKQEGE